MAEFTRREMLRALAALTFAGIQTGERLVDFADLDGFKTNVRQAGPRVRVYDLRNLTALNISDEEFYTFHQTFTVTDTPQDWALRISGQVETPRRFPLEELKQRPDRRDLDVTLECSGNTPGPGANGLVSNGTWTGCGLAALLKECGIRPAARDVAFFGMDIEMERDSFPAPHGRSVYLEDALHPDAMLAYTLNGKPLSADRGYPLRLILPGWYGMTNIKWLERIEVLDRRYEGPHMSRNYHAVRTLKGELLIETSIARTQLKSVVARVTRRRQGAGDVFRIMGAAWGGPRPIRAVEVRVDDQEWRPARIDQRGKGSYSWLLWSLEWPDARPGPHTLVSRAIDSAGNLQPALEELRSTLKSARENNAQWPRKIVI